VKPYQEEKSEVDEISREAAEALISSPEVEDGSTAL
jgi:hypothetical protein